MGEIRAYFHEEGIDWPDFGLTPLGTAGLSALVDEGIITRTTAKEVVFRVMVEEGRQDAARIVEERGLAQVSDTGELERLVAEAIEANPKAVEDFRGGKEKALGAMVGYVMKATQGQANPQMVNELLREKLAE